MTEASDVPLAMSKETMLLLMTAATIAAETYAPGNRDRDKYLRVARELGKIIDNA